MDKNQIKEFIVKKLVHNKKIKEMFKDLLDDKIGAMARYIDEYLKTTQDEGLRKAFLNYSIGDLEYVKRTYENLIKYELKEVLEKSLHKKFDEAKLEIAYLEAKDDLLEQEKARAVVKQKISKKPTELGAEKVEMIPDDKMILYFSTDYKVVIKPGPKRKGLLIINNKHIEISAIESDLCVALAKQIQDDWKYIGERDPLDVGWVSFEAFIRSVSRWSYRQDKGEAIVGTEIINTVYRVNSKIRKALKFNKKDKDLIENGKYYGRSENYRFRVYPRLIAIE